MSNDAALVQGIIESVAIPLMVGGPLRPVSIIGPAHAKKIAQQALFLAASSHTAWLDSRVAHVRKLVPVDALPALSLEEWLMIVAFNDMVCSTDPALKGLLSPGKAEKSLRGVRETLALVPSVRTLGEALARHGTFARMMQVQRTDTVVSWWCGSTTFVGREPPQRLLSWPSVRKVRQQRLTSNLSEMAGTTEENDAYRTALRSLLERTPLTDLATAGRNTPPFAWMPSTTALVTGAGRRLALRALRLSSNPAATVRRATHPQDMPALSSLIQELEALP
jgi:hypothetical protein